MGRFIGILLVLAGAAIICVGLVGAITEIRDLYAHATSAALDQPDIAEEDRPGRILRHVFIGAAGLPPLLIGSILITRARVRRIRARLQPRPR